MEKNEQPPFRIGGRYRNLRGEIVVLAESNRSGEFSAKALPPTGPRWENDAGIAAIRLSDGWTEMAESQYHDFNLIPGELTETGEPISATRSDYFKAQIEAEPATLTIKRAEPQAGSGVSPGDVERHHRHVRRSDEITPPPLRYRTEEKARAEFNNFPGFTVTSGATPGRDTVQGLQGGHPLQRMSDGTNPAFGSAALLKKV